LVETCAFQEFVGAVPKGALWEDEEVFDLDADPRASLISVETEGLPWPRCKSIPFDFSNTRSPRGI